MAVATVWCRCVNLEEPDVHPVTGRDCFRQSRNHASVVSLDAQRYGDFIVPVLDETHPADCRFMWRVVFWERIH